VTPSAQFGKDYQVGIREGYLFISFEGIEGSGKSTQIAMLFEALRVRNIPALATREPGGTAIGAAIRTLLRSVSSSGMTPWTEVFLVLADRNQHIGEIVRPALASGIWVLTDRFLDSTLAYQGSGRGLDPARLQEFNRIATGSLAPHLTFLLDCPTTVSRRRITERWRGNEDSPREGRFEQEPDEFHIRVRRGYLELAAADDSGRFHIVDSSRSIQEVHEIIWRQVQIKAAELGFLRS